MTTVAILMAVTCEIALVIGQLLLKRGMTAAKPRIGVVAAGVVSLSVWFFVWLALLARWDLSRLFPFEGLNPALVVIGAAIFLKERVPPLTWGGIVLISAGVAIVSSA
ncbi:MAG TPA: EamA family transporter [Thermoanaerobaculia bacterium]|nr:EamA family transporter [Thermoanaerobaculia bacterium]